MRSLVILSLLVTLTACSTVKSPAKRTPSDFGLDVKFVKAKSSSDGPKLVLTETATGASLAEAESIFTPDAVALFGEPPNGERFVVMASTTGRTIAVHEDASESSPGHRITVFEKASGKDWNPHSVQPETKDGPMYGFTAESLAVDDEYLYFRFGPKGPVKRQRLDLLSNW